MEPEGHVVDRQVQAYNQRDVDAFGAQVAGGRTEQGEEFGRASAFVLMRLQTWMAFGLP